MGLEGASSGRVESSEAVETGSVLGRLAAQEQVAAGSCFLMDGSCQIHLESLYVGRTGVFIARFPVALRPAKCSWLFPETAGLGDLAPAYTASTAGWYLFSPSLDLCSSSPMLSPLFQPAAMNLA